jgi:hypothetical protein
MYVLFDKFMNYQVYFYFLLKVFFAVIIWDEMPLVLEKKLIFYLNERVGC